MKPQKVMFQQGAWSSLLDVTTLAKARTTVGIVHDGLPSNNFLGAYWTGQAFEVIESQITSFSRDYISGKYEVSARADHFNTGLATQSLEYIMSVFFPLDPKITARDIQGATIVYPNTDNTGWLFAHTQEGTHHDYELMIMGAIDGVFQPYFRQLQVDAMSETTKAAAELRFKLLSVFYGGVVVEARKIARAVYLGEREQKAHPLEGWMDKDITQAIATTKAKWADDKTKDLVHITPAITYAMNSLTMPRVETRWDRAARLKKEAEVASEGES